MNIREDLRRYLIETHQVTQTRRYKWLCTILVVLSLVSALHVFEPEYWQMRRVRRHIEEISPQWDAFKRANPGFEAVELFPRYDEAYGVRFAAKGRVPWGVDLKPLTEFMSSTTLPYSVDILKVNTTFSGLPRSPVMKKFPVLMRDGTCIEIDVPAEPYQPIRSKTNSPSSTARSRP